MWKPKGGRYVGGAGRHVGGAERYAGGADHHMDGEAARYTVCKWRVCGGVARPSSENRVYHDERTWRATSRVVARHDNGRRTEVTMANGARAMSELPSTK